MHNGEKVFFAFKWTDPTRSLRRIPMIKKEDGWHIVDGRAGIDGRGRLLRGQARGHLLRQAGDRRRGRLEPRSGSPARRQAAAAERARLPLHHRRQLRRHVAVEGLARRHARPRRRPVYRPAARRERRTRPRTRRATRAATGTIPAAPTTPTTTRAFPKGYRARSKSLRLPKDWKKTQDGLGKFTLDPNMQRRRERLRGASTSSDTDPLHQGSRRARSRSAP